jgi:NitT/TauT family transport system ATP-binding protein
LPRPRNRVEPKFRQLVDDIYARMTARPAGKPAREVLFPGSGIAIMLPRVSPNVLAGLMEAVAADPHNGRADLPALAASLQMEVDDLFPVADFLHFLHFAEVAEGDIRLTDDGKRFVAAGFDERKALFAQHVLTYVPLAAHIKRVLDERASHKALASRFRDELEDHMSEEDADQTLRAVISFARYGEAFAYDESSDSFSLENPA